MTSSTEFCPYTNILWKLESINNYNRLCEILGSMLFRNVSECKSQEMSYRFVLEDPRILEFVADEHKTNEMHGRAE